MDENHQPSVTQELGRLLPSITDGGRRGESSELFRVGAWESSALTTIQIILVTEKKWGSKATSVNL